jgi:hypothetical protein
MPRRGRQASSSFWERVNFLIQYVHANSLPVAFGEPLLQWLRFSPFHRCFHFTFRKWPTPKKRYTSKSEPEIFVRAAGGLRCMLPQCADEADAVGKQHPYPLGDKPLVDISIDNEITGYAELQSELLALSRDSKQIVAHNSSHFIIFDRPDLVVEGIRQVVDVARTRGKLSGSTQAFDHGLP